MSFSLRPVTSLAQMSKVAGLTGTMQRLAALIAVSDLGDSKSGVSTIDKAHIALRKGGYRLWKPRRRNRLDRQVGIVSSGSPSDDGFLWIHVENENVFSRLLRCYRKTCGKSAFAATAFLRKKCNGAH
jgi:hypothetical protein